MLRGCVTSFGVHGDPTSIGNASRPTVRGACLPPPVGRSNRRFRAFDRLLWLFLRSLWRQWKDALLLVPTVDRWHRDRFGRRWWRRSRRPGRPRIDAQVRDLIARLADENRLWGAPRIHGELLKLGIVVSERTVSRYLRGRPRSPSQTWRTFLANHVGQLIFISERPSSYASGDNVVDALTRACPSSPSSDRLCASTHCSLVDWPAPVRRTCLGSHFTQGYVRDRSRLRTRSARAPPRNVRAVASRRTASDCSSLPTTGVGRTTGCVWRDRDRQL